MDVEAKAWLEREAPEALRRIGERASDPKVKEELRHDADKYLTDRAYGRPSQAIQADHSGSVTLKVVRD